MIKGFLEWLTPGEMRGWAFDPDSPDEHLRVEVLCGGDVVGHALADLYRHDLENAGCGGGDHAFTVTVDPPLPDADLDRVSARAGHRGGPPQPLRRLAAVRAAPPPPPPPVQWPGRSSDPDHRPVFILGAARSGTSAVTYALLEATRYQGHGEGHFLDFLTPLLAAHRAFQATKGDERVGDRNTTAARIAGDFVEKGLAAIAIEAMRAVFPQGLWLDKTPYPNMVRAAPFLRGIWPRARFIFMRRRAVENVASRLRKFGPDFAHHCLDWAEVMQAWLLVRDRLTGVAIELDQLTLAREPEAAAAAIGSLLDLPAVERQRVAQLLARERVERTGDATDVETPLLETGWPADWIAAFRELCGPMMRAYLYRE